MSVARQYGLHELPGTEQPAPQPRGNAGFELEMRGIINAIWARIEAIELKLSSPAPVAGFREPGEAKAGRVAASLRPSPPKPWEAEGVSRRTWFRRKGKEAPDGLE